MNRVIIDNENLQIDAKERKRAEKIIIQCGVRSDLNGFNLLVDCVLLFNRCHSGSVYEKVGEMYGLKNRTVTREIEYAISHAVNLPQTLSALIGAPLPPKKPNNRMVIGYLNKLLYNTELGYKNSSPPNKSELTAESAEAAASLT